MAKHHTLAQAIPARRWMGVLARYREPSPARSLFEILITTVPFVLLWLAAWWAMSVSYWLTLALAIPAAGFLVRLFLIQHDCGHGSFFLRRSTNDWVGRALGVVTMTPYGDWSHHHAIHHASSGNLDHRGFGDIVTLTVREYAALPAHRRVGYRLYRNPLVMFGIGPAYVFLIRNRLPSKLLTAGRAAWLSVMGTNLAIAAAILVLLYAVGWRPVVLVHLPIVLLAATIGVWLFYVQHQFEETHWSKRGAWNRADAALLGSSHYALPQPLRWMTANIGVHHVHHLSSRIPFYRLQQVLRDHPELAAVRRLTLRQSLGCLRLRLWDEGKQRLVSFKEARLP